MSTIRSRLECARDELVAAHLNLECAITTAHLSALHSTHTAAMKRILAFNDRTIKSVGNLLTVLKRRLPTAEH